MKDKASRCLSKIVFGLVGKFWTMLKSGLLDAVKLSLTLRLSAQKIKRETFQFILKCYEHQAFKKIQPPNAFLGALTAEEILRQKCIKCLS